MFAATVLTLFPEMFPGPLGLSLAGDALARGLWSLRDARHSRAWARPPPRGRRHAGRRRAGHGDARRRARGEPRRGAGARRSAPAADHEPARRRRSRSGARANGRRGRGSSSSARASRASTSGSSPARGLIEVSIGDYVLSGGEIAALAVLDACVRLLPGVMGKPESGEQESFEAGLLEYPHYTRPREWEGRTIPDVLLSGDHERIEKWRRRRGGADHARAAAGSVVKSPHPALRAAFSHKRERLYRVGTGCSPR